MRAEASISGLFISFEGGEGAGKSTQMRLLAVSLREAGHAVIETREPGGSPLAEAIRTLILTHDAASDDAMTQALLFAAARRDHLQRIILPALQAGKIVLCDRFIDSTRAYQGGRMAPDALEETIHLATGGLVPDITILLDLPVEAGLARAKGRATTTDTFERADVAFHQGVRARFLALAEREPARFCVLDALESPQTVTETILSLIGIKIRNIKGRA
jgi:dTMP kinase